MSPAIDHQQQCKRVAEVPVELGHEVEIHAVDAGDQRRRHEHHRDDREDLDDVVLLDVDQAERGFQQERGLRAEEAGVVRQRGDVAADRVKAVALLAGHRRGLLHEHQQPAQAHQALARLGVELAVEADALDHAAQVAAVGRAVAALGEDAAREVVEIAADALQHVSEALGERFHQAGEQRQRGGARGRMLFGVRDELLERLGIEVAVRHQARAGEDERHRHGDRPVGVELRRHRGGHVQRAVVLVQPVRGLDLLHFLARRHVDAERVLDQLLFVGRRLEQVDPDRLVGIFGGEPGVVRASPCGCWKKMFSMPWDAARRARQPPCSCAASSSMSWNSCGSPPAIVWSVRYLPFTTIVGTELIW